MSSRTRELADAIQRITGESLLNIDIHAGRFVQMGLCKTREEALQFLFDQAEEEAHNKWADEGYKLAVKSGTQPEEKACDCCGELTEGLSADGYCKRCELDAELEQRGER